MSVLPLDPSLPDGLAAFDSLATMVLVVEPDGRCLFANAAFEELLGLSRRSVLGESVMGWFVEPGLFKEVLTAVARNDFATSRLQGHLRRHRRPQRLYGHARAHPNSVQIHTKRGS